MQRLFRRTACATTLTLIPLSAGIVITTVAVHAQVPQNVLKVHQKPVKFLTTPNGKVTAIIVAPNANGSLGDVVFCVAHAKPLATPLNWSGPATVLYEAMGLIPGFGPAPEQLGIGAGVAVLPDAGNGWLFESPGTKAPLRPEDKGKAGNASRMAAQLIRMAPTKPGRVSFCADTPGAG